MVTRNKKERKMKLTLKDIAAAEKAAKERGISVAQYLESERTQEARVAVTIRISPAAKETAEKLAQAEDITVTSFLRNLVESQLVKKPHRK